MVLIWMPGDRMRDEIEATRVAPKLYLGSAPPIGPALADGGFKTVVLCAREYQPADSEFPAVEVLRVPLDDRLPTQTEFRKAIEGARAIARRIRAGKRTLVTCVMGRNRSAFVTAIALHMLTGKPGQACADWIQEVRTDPTGEPALQNEFFVRILDEI